LTSGRLFFVFPALWFVDVSYFPWEALYFVMNGSAKVGLFIDLENLRYELLKRGREFDPQRLIQKARKYGLVKVAYAYADFTKQPELLQGKFEASMIKRVDVPLRLRDDGRLKSSADLHMVMDIFETVLFNDDIETFILGTGDKDFTRASAMLVNRFGKRVVISGVPGSVSQVLVDSATVVDPIDPEEHGFGELEVRVAGWMDWMSDHWDHPMYMGIVRYLASGSRPIGLSVGEEDIRGVLNVFMRNSIIFQEPMEMPDNQVRQVVRVNRDHPFVQEAVARRRKTGAERGYGEQPVGEQFDDPGE
jgi:uncharacterized LabA/DUF88 family protein